MRERHSRQITKQITCLLYTSMDGGKIVIFGGGVPLKSGDTIIGGLGISGGTGEAVSYTHLDVYKRQVRTFTEITQTVIREARLRNYENLPYGSGNGWSF